jgi:hypothetical protein
MTSSSHSSPPFGQLAPRVAGIVSFLHLSHSHVLDVGEVKRLLGMLKYTSTTADVIVGNDHFNHLVSCALCGTILMSYLMSST